MLKRRHFLKNLLGAGFSMPFLSGRSISTIQDLTSVQSPLILCSRGGDWASKILTPAWQTYLETSDILDGVEAGANVAELDPDDMSVGYGGLPNEDGRVTLDASVMYGPDHRCGSVAGLQRIKRACSVARLVMERTDHVMLAGPGALQFALAHGFPEEDLLTDKARRVWLRWKENLSDRDDWLPPADGDYELKKRPGGTINVLGLDQDGTMAGITTTSGLFGKIPGRVGDSPIIGAGLYVDQTVGAAGATGRGEEVIRTCGSFLVVEFMRSGSSPQIACEKACERIVEINGGLEHVDFNDKFVAINKAGEAGCAAILGRNESKPKASMISGNGITTIEGTFMKAMDK